MAFPVDILTNVDHETLEQAAVEYMSQLPYRNPEYLVLPNYKQIEIGLCNVSFVPLYGTDAKKKILALFSPDDSITVVGLYLLGKWWGVEEVLKTAEPSRTGLIKVSTLGERIVLYVLNRIVLRNEKSSEEVFFLCHGEHESAKILWNDGVAIGFYSFKPKGSLCRNFVTQCYQLPVLDTVFVRKSHRGKDHGVKILEDFVCSFRNEYTGLKFPLSAPMYKVCEKYLRIYPADKEYLWEVENIGGLFQRTLIANRLQVLKRKEKDHVVSKLIFEEEDATAPMEIEITKIQETTESTMEIMDETITDIMKEVDDTPLIRRSTSSNLKRRAIRENSEERLSKNIIRVEDIEAGVESPIKLATEGSLDNTFSAKDSEHVIRSTSDTVTATVTRISEFRGSQKEMGKYIITAISDGTPVTSLTTSEEIKSKKGSKEEFEIVKDHTVEIQGAIIGSTDQSQIQSVVDVEIVKMSTGTEEVQLENLENIKEFEEDKSVSETGTGEIKPMLDELQRGKAQSETDETFSSAEVLEEITEQPEIHAKPSEKEQVYCDVEITEKKEKEVSGVMKDNGKDLIEENRNDNIGPEKCEAKHEDTVLQQSVEVEDQTEKEVLCTEEVLCEQQKQCENEKEVSETHQRKTYKGTLFKKAKKHKLSPDDTKQVFTQSKLTQKRTSPETYLRRSKRLRHEPAKTVRSTKSVNTTQQRTQHHSKAVIQEKDTEQPVDKSEQDSSEVIEESSAKHQAETENEVKECEENELTVETVSTIFNENRQVEKTLCVVPAISELVERSEKSHEKAPQQSSVESVEVQKSKTTFEEHEERVEHSTETHSETKVFIVELHKVPSKEAGDDHGETDVVEQDELKDTVSFDQQIAEDTLGIKKQGGTLNTEQMEELACTTELETTDLIVLSKDEKTETEQSKKDQQDLFEKDKLYPKQGKQAKKKGLADISSRSIRLRDQPVNPGKTHVRRSTRGKEVILHKVSEPQTEANILTKERLEMDENGGPKESEMTNTNVDEARAASLGSSEQLIATETDDKAKLLQITEATEEKIPLAEAENDDATEKAIEEIKKIANMELNLAGETDKDIEMSSLVQEQDIYEKEALEMKSSEILICVDIDDKENKIQIAEGSEEEVSLVEADPDEGAEIEDGTPIIRLQKATVVLVDLSQVSQDREEDGESTDVLRHSKMEEQLKIDETEKNEKELEEDEQQEQQKNENTEKNPKEEKMEDTVVEKYKLDKLNEEPIPTEDQSKEKKMSNLALEKPVQENLEEAPVTTERSLRRRTIQVHSPPKRKSRHMQKLEAETLEHTTKIVLITEKSANKVIQACADLDEKDKAPQKLSVKATEKGIPVEDVAEKETQKINEMVNKETSLYVTKDTNQEAFQMREEAASEQQENHPLAQNDEETAETENLIEMDLVVSKEQTNILKGTIIHVEEEVSQVEKLEEQDVALKEKQADSEAQISSIAHGAAESVQEIIKEETPFSTERSLRQRTIIFQSPQRKKSKHVQKQEAEAFEDKIGKLTVTGKVVKEMNKEITKIDGKEKMPQNSTLETTDDEIPLAEEKSKECVAEKVAEEINQVENKVTYTNEKILEMEEANLAQQDNDLLVINEKKTTETEESLEICPVVSKEQPYMEEGTTIQVEKEVSQVECIEPNESDHEGITRRSLRLSTKSVKTTQKTRASTRLRKAVSEPVKEVDEEMKRRDEYEESSATTEETGNVCVPVITVETNLKSLDELANTNVVETPAVEPENSEFLLGVEIYGKEEEPQPVKDILLEETEPDNSVKKDDRTSVMQLQKATVVLVDLNKLSQKTGESDTPKFPTHSQTEENMELDRPVYSEHQFGNLTAEEKENQVLQMKENIEKTPEQDKMQEEDTDEKQHKLNKQDETFEGQNLTEDLEKTNYVMEKKHLEATAIAEKSNINQDGKKDQDVDLKEKQTESEAEMSNLLQESAVSVQEILVQDEAPVSIERRLRQRTIKVQSTPRKKSRGVEKQEAEASRGKIGKVPITRKVAKEMHEENAKVNGKKETFKQSTVEAIEKIPFIEAESEICVTEKVAEEINKVENKETNLVVAKDTDVEAPKMKTEANLEQQESYPLTINEKETTETEKPMEINEDPMVNMEQMYVFEETTIHLVKEEVSHVESTESNQSDHERIKRRSLRLGAKSVTLKQKNRKSTRLHSAELELVKEADMSRDEFEETSATTGETSLEILNKTMNMNVEETPAVEPVASELLIGVELYEEAPQTVEEVLLEDIRPDGGAEKDDDTPVIQLQKSTVVYLIKHSQNTEGQNDTLEVPTHCQTEENMELDNPVYSEHQLCNLRTEEEEQQEQQKEENTEKALEEDKVEEERTDEEQNEPGKQDITEEQIPTDDLERLIDVQRTKTAEKVTDEHVQEAVKSGEHSEATTMAEKTNIQETENDQNIALKDKHAESDVEISYLAHEAAEAVQEALEAEAPVSTERSLRRRTIQIQSPLKRKSRRLQKQEAKAFEDTKAPITGYAVDEMQKEGTKIDDKEQTLQESTIEATSAEIPPVETEPEVAEKVEMMENKEINKMKREGAILEQQKNENLIENLMETDEVSMVTKEQTYIVKETTLQAELELTKEADMSRHEDNSSMTIETVEVHVQSKTAETNVKVLNVYGDMVSVTGNVETNSDERGTDTSNDGGKVDGSLGNIYTDKDEDEIESSIKTTENTIEETQKDLVEGVQEEEKAKEKSNQELEDNIYDKDEIEMITHQIKAVSQEDNVRETNPEIDIMATAVEGQVALEKTDQETSLITRRSLRSRTVKVQSTPRRTSKRLHRHEVESEEKRKGDMCGNDSALQQLADDVNITVENIAEFKTLDTKEQENFIQVNSEENAAGMERREDTVEEGKVIQENNEQEKTHDDNLEREDVQVSKYRDEEEVSDVLDEEKQLQGIEYESAAGVQGSSSDLEEKLRFLRKRTTVKEAAPRKSKRSRKQVHIEDIEQVKDAIMGQSESVEDDVELRSDESTVVFEASNSQEEILQEIQSNTEENNRKKEKTDETLETVIEHCLEAEEQHLESSANEGFTLELEVEETSDLEENKEEEDNSVSIEAPKEVSTSAEKPEESEENTSDNDEKGLFIEKHARRSSKAPVSARRKSMRLQMHQSKKKTNESESEVHQAAKGRRQRK